MENAYAFHSYGKIQLLRLNSYMNTAFSTANHQSTVSAPKSFALLSTTAIYPPFLESAVSLSVPQTRTILSLPRQTCPLQDSSNTPHFFLPSHTILQLSSKPPCSRSILAFYLFSLFVLCVTFLFFNTFFPFQNSPVSMPTITKFSSKLRIYTTKSITHTRKPSCDTEACKDP